MFYSPLPFWELGGLFCHIVKRRRLWLDTQTVKVLTKQTVEVLFLPSPTPPLRSYPADSISPIHYLDICQISITLYLDVRQVGPHGIADILSLRPIKIVMYYTSTEYTFILQIYKCILFQPRGTVQTVASDSVFFHSRNIFWRSVCQNVQIYFVLLKAT